MAMGLPPITSVYLNHFGKMRVSRRNFGGDSAYPFGDGTWVVCMYFSERIYALIEADSRRVIIFVMLFSISKSTNK
jgi:hypothetical protein